MKRGPNPEGARGWLFALGGLGVIVVILSVAVFHIDSGVSILGYVIGFICLLLAAMGAFVKRDRKDSE
ncbi:hypothetical protein [Alicyclobacillus fastidiosus]|uniref:Uncharacterized protein n=2 Tax=Alicyclobacillus fastidiosus TaxID=392011 RepID=A0ABV5ABJ7_9BACL|nr:hypothetical protein [Alicyclobacillus fastidiosus]WAH42787.1 hypothetical protein NZD89_04980 [Alicyclobacillus fastidiosus]WEH10393.1 hypothetical protein PYS47_03945 [Alicyclobacillus fastidiosus]GMA64706.1 hypothetical protein GCM10025859_51460 [Alicyclobacillus fastidiosus]